MPGGCALLGFLIGTLATGDVERGANGAGAGYLVGAATAVAIDAFWFAREPVEPPA